ncbi:DEAD/DEAH box helicase family protein [uncultured Pseudokineococcus sp.]|uniref:DEAD/DEAH box helicase family protein n=1 Tax=uncultured Pseudokineococcus sp. TaxID=1642928 RepID=UPI002637AAFB|nr:DEAD/DEAH box helicase family protein [uncultured Pseudokineococcus sp.]
MPPTRGDVFVRKAGDDRPGRFVHPELAACEEVRDALAVLGIEELDAKGELQHLLAAREPDWDAVWTSARGLPLESAREAIAAQLSGPPEYRLRVRSAAGEWVMPAKAFLPGPVIPADGGRDSAYLIDPAYHAADMALLRSLGAVSEPVRRPEPLLEPWRQHYEDDCRETFREESRRTRGSRPDPTKVLVTGRPPMWPLALLPALSPEGRAEMAAVVMADGAPAEWCVKHASAKAYGTMPVISPELWYLRKYAHIKTSFGCLRPDQSLVADAEWSADVLPVAEMSAEAAEALGARRSPEAFDGDVWAQVKTVADGWQDDARRAALYRLLEGRIDLAEVVVRVGPRRISVPVDQIGVTADPDVYGSLLDAHEPALFVADEAHVASFLRMGMRDGGVVLRQEVVPVAAGEAVALLDTYRLLQNYLEVADHGLLLQRCSRLTRLVSTPEGQVERPLAAAREGERVLVTATEPAVELQQISDVLKLGLSQGEVTRCLESAGSDEARALRRRIRALAADDLDQALVELIGVDELTRSLPRQAFAVLRESVEADPRRVAGLARSVHGVGILRHFTDVLLARQMEPPRSFSGGPTARRFVTELGLPEQWAGFIPRPRPATEVVEGRPDLPALHDYQRIVMTNIKRLLSGVGPERGMVSLPTGAGKTRVAVQALVEQIRDVGLGGPVVWIAQSDELCEQAAESWSFLWRAIGPALPLAIGRLWADNELEEQSSAQQVVIATDHKLLSIMERTSEVPEYAWLRRASVVVVDEAHTSVSQKYVKVLDWLGRDAGRKRSGRPLIGLSATPFRGNDSAETRRLVAKYDHNRLDDGAFSGEPYAELQSMGVLARVRPETLKGVEHTFNDAELEEIDTYGRFPAAVERRLGADGTRNATIVDSIAGLPDDWTVLLFATSVENARTLAALLSHRGIPSVSVSADTEPAARRHYVEEFRAGRIRVLTNHSVLTQGFDAPAVRAVYVTRPTFSPNVYQQMVGRGLRGLRNGGSEEVLIVNVEDNFNTYGDKLAFREFDDVWRR